MNLQVIKSVAGNPEYVLLPMRVYRSLHDQIDRELKQKERKDEYELFDVADYVDNPVALARIKAGITQEELAKKMSVSQAYISKIERQETVTPKLLAKVKKVIGKIKNQ